MFQTGACKPPKPVLKWTIFSKLLVEYYASCKLNQCTKGANWSVSDESFFNTFIHKDYRHKEYIVMYACGWNSHKSIQNH